MGLALLRGCRILRDEALREIVSPHFTPSFDERLTAATRVVKKAIDGLFSLGLKVKGRGEPLALVPIRYNNGSDSLPVAIHMLPYWDCGIFCLILAEAYHFVGNHSKVDDWIRTAVWRKCRLRHIFQIKGD